MKEKMADHTNSPRTVETLHPACAGQVGVQNIEPLRILNRNLTIRW